MKHGKAKSKAASKASGKKSSKTSAAPKVSAKSSKASPVTKKQVSSSGNSAAGNGKPVRLAPGDVNFANAVVGNAFKRAVKKYPNAFRRLTD